MKTIFLADGLQNSPRHGSGRPGINHPLVMIDTWFEVIWKLESSQRLVHWLNLNFPQKLNWFSSSSGQYFRFAMGTITPACYQDNAIDKVVFFWIIVLFCLLLLLLLSYPCGTSSTARIFLRSTKWKASLILACGFQELVALCKVTVVSTKVVPHNCKSLRDNADWYYG